MLKLQRELARKRPNLNHPAFTLIDDGATLDAALANWRATSFLALDTEFVRETTYYPKLCLVQVSDGVSSACVDVLSLDPAALQRLASVLIGHADPTQGGGRDNPAAQEKIFHSASQDLEIFVQLAGVCPQPLFDTQTAAALLGEGDQLSYAALVEKHFGVVLDKSLTRTDWSRRPLSNAELAYAAADVSYLADLYPLLSDRLAERGRLTWLREDCARAADPTRYRTLPEEAWRRLKGLARLAPPARNVAAGLADWRERTAQARDRPRKWILDDDALYRISERAPASIGALEALAILPPKTLERHGAALLEIVNSARDTGASLVVGDLVFDDVQKARFKRLQEHLRGVAERLGISASLLAPRADLEAVVRYGVDAAVPLLKGWRREVVGEELLKLM